MKNYLLVAIGGLIGSVARYWMQGFVADRAPSDFPYGTLLVNILGCFLIGLFFALAQERNLISPEWRILLTTGFCGGFTTFSTFSFEALALMREGNIMYAGLYVGGSVLFGFFATYAGWAAGGAV
jgi:CrcB protein